MKLPVADVTAPCHLIHFGADGREVTGAGGGALAALRGDLATATDVVILCHGWKKDRPKAIDQFARWITMFDKRRVEERLPGCRPVYLGVHWPSLLLGDESAPGSAGGVPPAEPGPRAGEAELVRWYTQMLGVHPERDPEAFDAVVRVVRAARGPKARLLVDTLTGELTTAYRTVARIVLSRSADLEELDLGGPENGLPEGGGPEAGWDFDAYDPQEAVRSYDPALAGDDEATALRERDWMRNALLWPFVQLTFWAMKRRARELGEGAVHGMLCELQTLAGDRRIHLMGHSFGCLLVNAAVLGRPGDPSPVTAVRSLLLVQGAVSVWLYSAEIPGRDGWSGRYRPVVTRRLVAGPILATTSEHDVPIALLYPQGARLARDVDRAGTAATAGRAGLYSGLGAFGVQGLPEAVRRSVGDECTDYDFAPGRVYTIEATAEISGHDRFVGESIGHLFWQAALAPVPAGRAGRGADVRCGAGGYADCPTIPADPCRDGEPTGAGS